MASPSRVMDSWVVSVSSACWKSGPLMVAPGARCMRVRFSMTSLERLPVFATWLAVARSVNASTPFRR